MIKLIIWDLDETLWNGTLADGEAVALVEERAALIRAFNARGVVSSICSKNDFETAKAKLVELGLWDEFVFPHIAFTPKPQAIAGVIEDMQLRPANVLFVDDNPINLNEVRYCLPDIQLLDITRPDADEQLRALLAAQKGTRSRVDEYRILERKRRDRAEGALSNEDFLRSCAIRACAPYLMDNLDFVDRIAELINRSNQLNYTASRVEADALRRDIIDVVGFDSWSIFAWDRYGHYGLVGFVMVDRRTARFVHFTFSCRAMHMGLEEYALRKVREKWPRVDSSTWDGRFSRVVPDWIEDCSFHDPVVRAPLIAGQVRDLAETADLRIMFDCQSGGIAHFSRHRAAIDFDNNPRLFALRSVNDGSHEGQHYPPFLVYGAGIDYSDPRWPVMAHLLHAGLYQACVERLCTFLEQRGCEVLIVLPPESTSEEKYRPHMGHTRLRTQFLNAIWRAAARVHPGIRLLDMDEVALPDEMADVSHYHAGLLRKLAGQIDDWYDARRLAARPQAA